MTTPIQPLGPQTDQNFLKAKAFTMVVEGGWYDGKSPGDPNPTMHGIIQKTYDDYRSAKGLSLQSVQLISDAEVGDIYWEYWLKAQCPIISLVSSRISTICFDTGFNSGEVTAIKLLQHAIGTDEDGVFGPQSTYLLKQKVQADENGTVIVYLTARYNYDKSLHNWNSWGHIWTNRLNKLSVAVNSTWSAQWPSA